MGVNPEIEFREPIIDYGDYYVRSRLTMMQRAHSFVREQNTSVQNRNKERYDASAKPHGYKAGDWVWLKREEKQGSLDRVKWIGPFRVSEVINEQNIRLILPKGNRQHEVVHANRLKRDSAVQKEDISGNIVRTLDTKRVRGINGRLVNKAFLELVGGHTMWVPEGWVH